MPATVLWLLIDRSCVRVCGLWLPASFEMSRAARSRLFLRSIFTSFTVLSITLTAFCQNARLPDFVAATVVECLTAMQQVM